ncbi:hypothetical protein BKA62DRAFT_204182 [Auriculariales sp. MPI-PUGE-AT-0066]|nr:hypothetical protein BKA62DRAFT_204182 [Auriculariales sp. MPI-PUGE-AT-0066]
MRRRREVQRRQARTIDWTGPAGNSSRVDVPECKDGAGLILTAGDDTGTIKANMNFKGSFIELYGTRHNGGAPGIIVVDGDYSNPVHIDQSLAAVESTDTPCIKIASFYNLQPTDHILEVTLGSGAMKGMTFIVANVT